MLGQTTFSFSNQSLSLCDFFVLIDSESDQFSFQRSILL